jgi:hypothetical protein
MRDERVEAFASLLWEGVHEYEYVARATTPGNFVVPPPKAEEMYMPETFGRGGPTAVVEDLIESRRCPTVALLSTPRGINPTLRGGEGWATRGRQAAPEVKEADQLKARAGRVTTPGADAKRTLIVGQLMKVAEEEVVIRWHDTYAVPIAAIEDIRDLVNLATSNG